MLYLFLLDVNIRMMEVEEGRMAQKNLLPMILLGLLEKEPMTGYDLKKIFDTEVGEFWSVKHSQIYLELKRLLALEEIESQTGFFGNKIEKTYYKITEKGTDRLEAWLGSYEDFLSVNKDEFVLKLYFIRDRQDPRLQELILDQYRMRKEKLKHLQGRKELVFPTEKERQEHYGHALILEHAIRRETEYVKWLEEIIEECR